MLDHRGRVLADRKQAYPLAFGVHGLAEHHRATGSAEALDRAIRLYRAIEEHAVDPVHGGSCPSRCR